MLYWTTPLIAYLSAIWKSHLNSSALIQNCTCLYMGWVGPLQGLPVQNIGAEAAAVHQGPDDVQPEYLPDPIPLDLQKHLRRKYISSVYLLLGH